MIVTQKNLPNPAPVFTFAARSGIVAWCNGNTTDFGSVILGSSPGATTEKGQA
jgi:hypothetical protein